MADQRIQATENMIGANHPTLTDTLNRLSLVEHNTDGTHKVITGTPNATLGATVATTANIGDATVSISTGCAIQSNKATACTGTITTSSGSTTVTGVGTVFHKEFQRGDAIICGGETQYVWSITNATTLNTVTAWTGTFVAQPFTTTAKTRLHIDKAGSVRIGSAATSGLGSTSLVTVDENYTNAISPTAAYFSISDTMTSVATTGSVRGLWAQALIGSTNTQDWTGVQNPGLQGIVSQIYVANGATGTISHANTIRSQIGNYSAGATISKAIDYAAYDGAATGTITNRCSYLSVAKTTGWNICHIALGTNATTLTLPNGNWGIYDETGYNSAFSGKLRIGDTTVPSATLDVTGTVAATGTISTNGNIILDGQISANGAITCGGTITAAGKITTSAAVQAASATLSGAMQAASATLSGNLTCSGILASGQIGTLNAISAGGNIGTTSNISANGTITAGSTITGSQVNGMTGPSNTLPQQVSTSGVANAGTSNEVSRADHVHPITSVVANTFTPTLAFQTNGNALFTYNGSFTAGSYKQFFNMVMIEIVVVVTAMTQTTASGGLMISNLPVTNPSTPQGVTAVALYEGLSKTGATTLGMQTDVFTPANGVFFWSFAGSGAASVAVAPADCTGSGGAMKLKLTVTYHTN